MDKDTKIFQYYPGDIKKCRPLGFVTLNQFIEATRHPKPATTELFNQIAAAAAAGDEQLKSELKTRLVYFTPSVIIKNWRTYENILSFTGLLLLDFDKIPHAEELKAYLFETYHCIIAAYLSPSKRGTKALVKIPVCTSVNEYKSFFYGIAAEMDQYAGFDPSNQNPCQPLFQSWDADLLFRDNPDTWTERGIRRSDIRPTTPTTPPAVVVPTTSDQQKILDVIDSAFASIIDYGHPPLRDLCYYIGGFVASGYISLNEVLSVINNKIEHHHYLKKNISGYQRTAEESINAGMKKPLTLQYSHA